MWPSDRKGRLGVIVFACMSIIMLYDLVSGAYHLFHAPPPLQYYSANVTYWLFAGLGLPSVTASSAFYFTFLATVPLMVWLHRFPLAAWAFSLLLAGYIITVNILAGHHYHAYVGAFALTIPFWFKGERAFSLAWAGVRYYACFFFASAALWKIFRGSVFTHGHIANLIRSDQTHVMATQPDTWVSGILFFLADNPWVGDVLFVVVTILQLGFLVGFITMRFDRMLLLAMALLLVGNFVFFHVASWHVLILGCCFLPRRWLTREAHVATSVHTP